MKSLSRSRSNKPDGQLAVLRRRAEKSLYQAQYAKPSPMGPVPGDLETLLHEVEVHRVELEMQCKQLQESQLEVERSRRRYQELYEAVPIGYATIDVNGKIHDVNPAGLALLKVDSLARLHNFHSFVSPQDVDRFLLACREVWRQRQPCGGELTLVQGNGARFEADCEIHPSKIKSSTLAVTFQDIGFRKHNAALSTRLKSVEEGFVDLTHQVKGPAGRLREIATWIERDYGQVLDGKALRYLTWIKDESHDLAMLAEGILALASVDHQAVPREHLDVGAVVEEIVSRMRCCTGIQDAVVHIATDFPRVYCRKLHVNQVFQNLIENAFKYVRPQTHPCVEIGWRTHNSGIEFYVRDNGVGIEPSMIDKIFTPFVRLNTVQAPGSGIGLSIVKKVLAEYNESIRVESSPGIGTTFSFRLPLSSTAVDRKRVHGSSTGVIA